MIFGITGGSGSGKSSVSKIFSELGVNVIDADKVARDAVSVGSECLFEIEKYFGSSVIDDGGSLKRSVMADIVFNDREKLNMLNKITHKYIKREIEGMVTDFSAIDGAVIIGSEIENMCDFIVSVLAPYDVRLGRIKKRDKISNAQAKARLNAQPDDDFYREHSRYIIYNGGTIGELREKVKEVYERIVD